MSYLHLLSLVSGEGDPIAKLIHEMHKVVVAEEKTGGGLLSAAYLEQIRQALGVVAAAAPRPSGSGANPEPDASLLEPLTAREQDIL